MYTVDNPIFEAVYEAAYGDIDFVRRILNAIAEVDGNDDKLDFVLALAAAKGFNQGAEWTAEQEESRVRNARKQLVRGKRDTVVTEWVMKNVKPGMMIKVTGTRDGQGWRKVIRWKTSLGEVLECQKWWRVNHFTGKRDADGYRIVETKWTEEPYITEHMPKKVIAVEIDGEWKKVVDLVKENDDG